MRFFTSFIMTYVGVFVIATKSASRECSPCLDSVVSALQTLLDFMEKEVPQAKDADACDSSPDPAMIPFGLFSVPSCQRRSVGRKRLDRSFAPRIDLAQSRMNERRKTP